MDNCPYRNPYARQMPGSGNMFNRNMAEPVGMAYVPWQRWGSIYEPCKGLRRGTIFPELDKPFERGACR